jgi:hypothetical protein
VVERLDGLLTFLASHHAIRAEKDLSPNCGVAVRFDYSARDRAVAALAAANVRIDELHFYQPSTDDFAAPGRRRRKQRHPVEGADSD